jgi:hypothetical protein
MSTAPRRRWYQFGIGTMLLLVTILAVWLGWELNYIRKRAAFLVENERLSNVDVPDEPSKDGTGSYVTITGTLVEPPDAPAAIPFWRRWLGDTPAEFVILPQKASKAYRKQAKSLFPEAQVISQD